jgi:outer membrane protein OmpA-like peptidoglycan-associated protein
MIRSFVYVVDKEKVKDSIKVKPAITIDTVVTKKEVLPVKKFVKVKNVIPKKEVPVDAVPDLPVGERLSTTTNISFEYNKYETQEHSRKIISDFLSKIKNIDNYDILLSGYADFTGEEHYNLWLSHKRIESVADYLVKSCGIKQDKIFCIAYGEYDKYVENAKKRKVVIELVDKNKLNNRILIVYKVEKTSTLVDIEDRFLCDVDDLCLINSFSKTKKIVTGSYVLVPVKGIHRVKYGNTLYSLSRDNGTSVKRVMRINNISSNNSISVNDILIIN